MSEVEWFVRFDGLAAAPAVHTTFGDLCFGFASFALEVCAVSALLACAPGAVVGAGVVGAVGVAGGGECWAAWFGADSFAHGLLLVFCVNRNAPYSSAACAGVGRFWVHGITLNGDSLSRNCAHARVNRRELVSVLGVFDVAALDPLVEGLALKGWIQLLDGC